MAKNNNSDTIEKEPAQAEEINQGGETAQDEGTAAVSGEVVTEGGEAQGEHVEGEVIEGKEHQTVATEGARARRAFMMKNLLDNPDFINTNVVAKGKGAKVVVGRVWGFANGYERKTNEFQGRLLESIVLKGVFQAESTVTGELSEFTSVYMPTAYAEKLAGLFEADKSIRMIEVDCDIGLEATGKTIPYEWVCIAFREGEEMQPLRRLRAGRKTGQSAWAQGSNLLTNNVQTAIENKSEA